jgi:hypothetical protein
MKNKIFNSVLLLLGLGVSAYAADPVIKLSKTSVDATSSGQTIAFTYSPGDVYIHLKYVQNPPNGVAVLWGWDSEGARINIPKGTYPGDWIISEVSYYEYGNQGQQSIYSRNYPLEGSRPLTFEMEGLSINVTNSNPDTVPPTIAAFDIDLNKLTKAFDGETLYAPCTLTVKDDNSGFEVTGDGIWGAFVGSKGATLSLSGFYWEKTGQDTYTSLIRFSRAQPGETFLLYDVGYADKAGNAVYHSPSLESYTSNSYTVNRTEPIPQIFNVEIQLPDNFTDIPLHTWGFSGSGDSSGSGAASSTSSSASTEAKKSKKKGKEAKKGGVNKKEKSATKSSSKSSKKSAASKSSGGKKSGGKKKKK